MLLNSTHSHFILHLWISYWQSAPTIFFLISLQNIFFHKGSHSFLFQIPCNSPSPISGALFTWFIHPFFSQIQMYCFFLYPKNYINTHSKGMYTNLSVICKWGKGNFGDGGDCSSTISWQDTFMRGRRGQDTREGVLSPHWSLTCGVKSFIVWYCIIISHLVIMTTENFPS